MIASMLVAAVICSQAEARTPPSEPAAAQTASAAASPAKAKADPELESQVRRLVRQLDAPQLRQRDAAEKELIALGAKALALLPSPDAKQSAETVQRLDRVRQQLQQIVADASVRESRVTLRADKEPLSKVLAQIARQTGNAVSIDREAANADPAVQVDLKDVPFWIALDTVLDQVGWAAYPYGEKKTLHVRPRAPGMAPAKGRVSYDGPLRIQPTWITAKRNLGNPAIESLRLELEAAWEPRLDPVALFQKLADVEAADERGAALPVASRDARIEMPAGGGSPAGTLSIEFALPPREVRRIEKLKGTLSMIVTGNVEKFRFTDLEKAKQVERRVAAATVALEDVSKNDALWQVVVSVKFDAAGDALASHRTWIFQNAAYLEGADGKPIKYDAMETLRHSREEVSVAYLFAVDKPIGQYAFVYETATAIYAKQFRYQLQGIPLP